jgi:hypothetical protein
MAEQSTEGSQFRCGPEPRVGIFWLVEGTLLTDSTQIKQAELYGDHLTHPESHIEVWEVWQKLGKVPGDVPYEEPPRGRVMFSRKTGEFVLLADKCILERKSVVAEITRAFALPEDLTIGRDSHYRCSNCLYGIDTEEDSDD